MSDSPEQWRDYLLKRLHDRWNSGVLRAEVRGTPWKTIHAYHEGVRPLQFATPKFVEAFGDMLAPFADNFCPIVVDAPVERLPILGVRFGPTSSADKDVWTMLQVNGFDASVPQVHTEAIKFGEAAWLVDPPALGEQFPRITPEHPSQVIVEADPGDPMTRYAALKEWTVRDTTYCTLWLPDRIVRWQRGGNLTSSLVVPSSAYASLSAWEPVRDSEKATVDNELEVVPVIPVRNRPDMLGGGRSDIEPVFGLFDAIDKLCADMLVGAEFTAWPQRVLTGVSMPKNPETGQPVPRSQLEAGASRLLLFGNPAAKAQEWPASDPGRLLKMLETFVQHAAAQTRTPANYLISQIVNISAEGMKVLENGLVARSNGMKPSFGEGHEEMTRVASKAAGLTAQANRRDAEVIWGDSETRTEAEKYDAAVKGLAVGLPRRVVWENLGMSPQEIDRAMVELQTEQLLAPGGLSQDGAAQILADRAATAAAQARSDAGVPEPDTTA